MDDPKILDTEEDTEQPGELPDLIKEAERGLSGNREEKVVDEQLNEEEQAASSSSPTGPRGTSNSRSRPRSAPSRPRRSGDAGELSQILEEEFPAAVAGAGNNLKALVTGNVRIVFSDRDLSYLLDCGSGKVTKDPSKEQNDLECVLTMSTESLLSILHGDLNPQVAMLSEKIQVKGAHSVAVYFFNLFLSDQRDVA